MAKVNNKELLQSYILTTAKYDFNVYEKRVLYCLVEMAQCEVEGLDFPKDCRKIDHDLFGFVNVSIPCSRILRGEEDKNHKRVKDALLSLTKKVIEYEDEKEWMALNIVAFPRIKKYENNFAFTIHPMIWDCILNFSKGYRKIEFATIKDFVSEYSMRFYELMSEQKDPLGYKIAELKAMFKLENKYKNVNDFIKKVIDVAKKELDAKSPYSFEYRIFKEGRKFHSIRFYPVYQPQHRDENIERQKLYNQLSLGWDLSQETIQYLKEVYLFDTKEINQHRDLFKQAEKDLDLLVVLARIKRHTENKNNPKGYVIQVLKNELAKLGGKEKVAEEKTQAPPEPTAAASPVPADMIKDLAKMYNQNK